MTTAAEVLANATTYNDKVDVLAAFAAATIDDATAEEVAEAIRLRRLGDVGDRDLVQAAVDAAKEQVEVGEAVLEAEEAQQPAGEDVTPSGVDVSEVEGVDEESPVGPVDAAEPAEVPSDSEAPTWGNPEATGPGAENTSATHDERDTNQDGDVQWNEFPKDEA